VRRRYNRGLINLFGLFRPLATTWTVCDNSGTEPVVVAQGTASGEMQIYDGERLRRIEGSAKYAERSC
jgi:predicted ABC-type ATPase